MSNIEDWQAKYTEACRMLNNGGKGRTISEQALKYERERLDAAKHLAREGLMTLSKAKYHPTIRKYSAV